MKTKKMQNVEHFHPDRQRMKTKNWLISTGVVMITSLASVLKNHYVEQASSQRRLLGKPPKKRNVARRLAREKWSNEYADFRLGMSQSFELRIARLNGLWFDLELLDLPDVLAALDLKPNCIPDFLGVQVEFKEVDMDNYGPLNGRPRCKWEDDYMMTPMNKIENHLGRWQSEDNNRFVSIENSEPFRKRDETDFPKWNIFVRRGGKPWRAMIKELINLNKMIIDHRALRPVEAVTRRAETPGPTPGASTPRFDEFMAKYTTTTGQKQIVDSGIFGVPPLMEQDMISNNFCYDASSSATQSPPDSPPISSGHVDQTYAGAASSTMPHPKKKQAATSSSGYAGRVQALGEESGTPTLAEFEYTKGKGNEERAKAKWRETYQQTWSHKGRKTVSTHRAAQKKSNKDEPTKRIADYYNKHPSKSRRGQDRRQKHSTRSRTTSSTTGTCTSNSSTRTNGRTRRSVPKPTKSREMSRNVEGDLINWDPHQGIDPEEPWSPFSPPTSIPGSDQDRSFNIPAQR